MSLSKLEKDPTTFNNNTMMYEIREEEIICSNDGKPTIRIARFLKPNAKNLNKISEIPKTPFVSDIFTHQNLQKWPLNVKFIGWMKPQKTWFNWFSNLVVNHGETWIEAGIIDGILASMSEIPCNYDLVLGVCEFWCPKTSSFIFPWGEATITLEDVMILGGFPVIGEDLNKKFEGNLVKFDNELRRVRREICESSKMRGENGEKLASHSSWLKHFMEEEEEGEIEHEEGEFEHVAFLSLWLSRFVFPDVSDEGVISNYVFPIAIHLSHGTPIALAPAVLANLYHELTLLTQNAVDLPLDSNYHACGLFKIVQLWVCERFPEFGANLAKPLEVGDPRVARWDNVEFEVTLSHVRSRLKVGEGFRWRPYASDLENWDYPPFYGESEQEIPYEDVYLGDCLLSYDRFLCSSEISGHETNCREKYQPHRVAMQFGFDQDIPGEFLVSDVRWDKHKGCLYLPSRNFQSGMSRSYFDWWKGSIQRHDKAVSDFFRRKRGLDSGGSGEGLVERLGIEEGKNGKSSSASWHMLERVETDVNESDKSNASNDLDKAPLALRLCSHTAKRNVPCNHPQSSSLKSPQIETKVNSGSGVLVAKSDLPADSVDIDHVPLALRLQSIARGTETLKSSESYASTENAGHSDQGTYQAKDVTPQGSDAVSYITRGGCSVDKTGGEAEREVEDNAPGVLSHNVLVRLAKLEKAVAALKQP